MNVPKLEGVTVTCSKNISFPAIGCSILSAIEQLIAGMQDFNDFFSCPFSVHILAESIKLVVHMVRTEGILK